MYTKVNEDKNLRLDQVQILDGAFTVLINQAQVPSRIIKSIEKAKHVLHVTSIKEISELLIVSDSVFQDAEESLVRGSKALGFEIFEFVHPQYGTLKFFKYEAVQLFYRMLADNPNSMKKHRPSNGERYS